MYLKIDSLVEWTKTEGTYTCVRINVSDSTGKYNGRNITVDNIMYTYNTNLSTGSNTSLGVYKITGVGRTLSSRAVNVTFKRLNDNVDGSGNAIDNDIPVTGFICSRTNGVDDVPFGVSVGISNDLTEEARTYNLTHMNASSGDGAVLEEKIRKLESKKLYKQVVDLNDIVLDEDSGKYELQLDYYPLSDVVMEINGVVYNEYDHNDFEVQRNNDDTAVIYFDSEDDNFSFEDLKGLSDSRVILKYMAYIV